MRNVYVSRAFMSEKIKANCFIVLLELYSLLLCFSMTDLATRGAVLRPFWNVEMPLFELSIYNSIRAIYLLLVYMAKRRVGFIFIIHISERFVSSSLGALLRVEQLAIKSPKVLTGRQ